MMDMDDVLETFVGVLLAGIALLFIAPMIRDRRRSGWF